MKWDKKEREKKKRVRNIIYLLPFHFWIFNYIKKTTPVLCVLKVQNFVVHVSEFPKFTLFFIFSNFVIIA